jgi:hypothetical protein
MKKQHILLMLILLISTKSIFAQSIWSPTSKKEFKTPGLKDSVKKHKVVAILPFTTTITYKVKSKNYDSTANRMEEKDLGYKCKKACILS